MTTQTGECSFYDSAAELERVRAERDEAAELLAYVPAYETDPCSLDHHGYCQIHPGGFRDGGCWVAAARAWLSAHPQETNQ